jgi:DNA-binding NarL/FixJ family response regulator
MLEGTGPVRGTILVANDRSGCMRDLQACGLEYRSLELGPELVASCVGLFTSEEPLVALVNFESQTEGPQTVACILQNHPAARVIAFADAWDDGRSLGALKSGVHATVNSSDGAVALLTIAIRELSESTCLTAQAHASKNARRRWLSLSDVEYRVVRAAFVGKTSLAVALECDISVRTVDRQRNSAFEKLDCETMLDVVTIMHDAGLYTLPPEHSDLVLEVGRQEQIFIIPRDARSSG